MVTGSDRCLEKHHVGVRACDRMADVSRAHFGVLPQPREAEVGGDNLAVSDGDPPTRWIEAT